MLLSSLLSILLPTLKPLCRYDTSKCIAIVGRFCIYFNYLQATEKIDVNTKFAYGFIIASPIIDTFHSPFVRLFFVDYVLVDHYSTTSVVNIGVYRE